MSTKEDDKYTREGDDTSQVRSIINLLNGEKPSTERSREVVVRPDGTKVVRVTKKRRVMVTKADKNRRARKNLLVSIILLLLLTFGFVAYGFYHYAHMVSDSYIAEKEAQMCKAWGAESVKITGVKNGIGTGLEIESVLVTFPQSCVVESVLLENLRAEVSLASYYTGEFQSEFLNIGRAHVQVRSDAQEVIFPGGTREASIWDFKNVHCDKFSLSVGEPSAAALNIEDSTVDMHAISPESYSFKMSGGKMIFAGLTKDSKVEFLLQDGFLTATSDSIRNMRINCKTREKIVKRTGERDDDNVANAFSLTFYGNITKENLYGPYNVNFTRAALKTLTLGAFDNIISGDVRPLAKEQGGRLQMHLTPAVITGVLILESEPTFKSSELLGAKDVIMDTIEPKELRDKVAVLNQEDSRVELVYENGSLQLLLPREDNGNEVSGVLSVSGFAEEPDIAKLPISGELVYEFPASYLCYKYADKAIDPVYEKVENTPGYYRLTANLSGTCAAPADDCKDAFDRKSEERRALTLNRESEYNYRQDKIENQSAINKVFDVKEPEDKDAIFKQPSEDDIFKKSPSSTPFFPESMNDAGALPGGGWESAPADDTLNPAADPSALPSNGGLNSDSLLNF